MLKRNKRCVLLWVATLLVATTGFGQSSNDQPWADSSYVPTRKMAQWNEFRKNEYPFPPKTRDRWELGVKGGLPVAGADVRYWGPTGGFGVHLRKSLGDVFSLRAEYDWLRLKGLNWLPSLSWVRNSVLRSYFPSGSSVFYNYRSTVHELSIQGVASLTNIAFHRNQTRWNVYVFGGVSAMTYSTFYKVLDKNGKPYDYSAIVSQFNGQFDYKHRNDIRKALKSTLNGPWSTMAERDPSQPTLGGAPLRIAVVMGAGIQYRLNSRFSLSLEDKFTSPHTDLLDGQQWAESGTSDPNAAGQTKENDSYHFFSLGVNYTIGNSHKRTEPRWWLNPLDYPYSELNKPRHMKMPKAVLDDTDGDGVPDQLDKEPNTPAGCPVDSHGVSRDTDGDGVPDCKDKELITPTRCQPVDADGVGKCPEAECCKDVQSLKEKVSAISNGKGLNGEPIGDMPSVSFAGKSTKLSKQSKDFLADVAKKMRDNPDRKVAVIGYGGSSKLEQQRSWERVNAVINYLIEKEGISPDRLIFRYGQSGGEANTIDFLDATGEQGPNTVPAPHPSLSNRNSHKGK